MKSNIIDFPLPKDEIDVLVRKIKKNGSFKLNCCKNPKEFHFCIDYDFDRVEICCENCGLERRYSLRVLEGR